MLNVITWQQLLAVRLAPQQIVQVTLVDSAISLCVAAQFGSRVTCSCHVTVALENLLAKPYCWPNLRVGTLVLQGGRNSDILVFDFYATKKNKSVFHPACSVLRRTDQLCRCDLHPRGQGCLIFANQWVVLGLV